VVGNLCPSAYSGVAATRLYAVFIPPSFTSARQVVVKKIQWFYAICVALRSSAFIPFRRDKLRLITCLVSGRLFR
jgi:hypothetical protein